MRGLSRKTSSRHARASGRKGLASTGLLCLAAALPCIAAAAPVLQAGATRLALPADSEVQPAMTQCWQGKSLWRQAFLARRSVDGLLSAWRAQAPAGADLFITPGLATLAWYAAPMHWMVQLSGRGKHAVGQVSGMSLTGQCDSSLGIAGMPGRLALLQRQEEGERVAFVYRDPRPLPGSLADVRESLAGAGWMPLQGGTGVSSAEVDHWRRSGMALTVVAVAHEGGSGYVAVMAPAEGAP